MTQKKLQKDMKDMALDMAKKSFQAGYLAGIEDVRDVILNLNQASIINVSALTTALNNWVDGLKNEYAEEQK